MAEFLHLDTILPTDTIITRELKRRVWWSLYSADRWCFSGLGLPRHLSDSDATVELPMDEILFHSLHYDQHESRFQWRPGLWAHMATLLRLFGPILDVNRQRAQGNRHEDDLDNNVADISQKLKVWLSMLPEEDQMSEQNLHKHQQRGRGGLFLALHLSYNYYVTLLYFGFLEQRRANYTHADFAARCRSHASTFSKLLRLARQMKGCETLYPTVSHMITVCSSALVHTLLFGSPAEVTTASDGSETNIINNKNEIGSITPENAMKWDAIQPSRGQFNWGSADQHANYATQRGYQLRCHTLVWYSQLPQWVSNGQWNNQTLQQVMQAHINAVVGRYKGRCTHWDVVNEALNEDGTYRDNVFLRVIGEAYIPIAFRMALAADPNTKLYYNDYNLEYGGAKTQGAIRIVKLVKSYGVRIDGVGLQGHMVTESTPTQSTPTPAREVMAAVLQSYADLGVDVAYTEVDIRMRTPANTQKLQQHADAYARLIGSCMDVERCVGITVWGISDRYSWVPGTFNGEGSALLWNENFQKKPAYTSTLNTINAR
ncbi:Endo-1,4-beta-xylanase A [Paramyrothecium foliicola]|nr:Endo-1,4-beta-xylanase A [Paramyrothecium foliicola]